MTISYPPGPNTYEFLVTWADSDFNNYPVILGTFTKHKANLLVTQSQLDDESNLKTALVYCDLGQADISAADLQKEIKKLGPVATVEWVSTQEVMFEKFYFPVVSRGNRWLIMRIRTLVNIEKEICEQLGTAGSALMFTEGVATGYEGSSYPGGVLSKSEKGKLLRNTADGLRACGWGLFDFKQQVGDRFDVTVEHPPLAEGASEPGRFLCGLVAGVLKSATGIDFKVDKSSIDSRTGRAEIRLSPVGS